jgi:hypothetical protein
LRVLGQVARGQLEDVCVLPDRHGHRTH